MRFVARKTLSTTWYETEDGEHYVLIAGRWHLQAPNALAEEMLDTSHLDHAQRTYLDEFPIRRPR